jgi:spore coat protein YutH
MENLLINHYDIHFNEKVTVDGKEGFKNDEYTYFTTLSQNREAIHMEQAALAYYLAENGYTHLAYPIKNIDGHWFTEHEKQKYIVLRVNNLHSSPRSDQGRQLAEFHNIGTVYHYEPETISSYGRWKTLWINKLTAFEQQITSSAKTKKNDYFRLLMDVLPYFTGIGENAIQYIQETMTDTRYNENDRGTIAFRRFRQHLQKPVIWTDDLVYDHPMRDTAEYIRMQLFKEKAQAEIEISSFMQQYQSIRPLSVFSWRLLYARLLFPIPFFDLVERSLLEANEEAHYAELLDLLDRQAIFERNAGAFFRFAGVDHERLDIPVLHWL